MQKKEEGSFSSITFLNKIIPIIQRKAATGRGFLEDKKHTVFQTGPKNRAEVLPQRLATIFPPFAQISSWLTHQNKLRAINNNNLKIRRSFPPASVLK